MIKHQAPPVVYPLGPSLLRARLLAAFWLAGLVLTLLWLDAARLPDWRFFLAFLALAAAGLAAFADWKNMPIGQLMWDGELWFWQSSAYQSGLAEQELTVIADFQHVLLLRIKNRAGASLWLLPERKTMPERWLDLRRAIFSTPAKAGARHRNEPAQASGSKLPEPVQAELLPAMAVSRHAQNTDSSPIKP